MGRIAFVKAEFPAVQVLCELDAGYAAQLPGLGAVGGHGAGFSGANGLVDDFRFAGTGKAQEQAEVVEAVVFVAVGCAVQAGALGVDDVDFAGFAEELVALAFHVGY